LGHSNNKFAFVVCDFLSSGSVCACQIGGLGDGNGEIKTSGRESPALRTAPNNKTVRSG
jgi:hypothetical protein